MIGLFLPFLLFYYLGHYLIFFPVRLWIFHDVHNFARIDLLNIGIHRSINFQLNLILRCKKWIVALHREKFVLTRYDNVCSDHFVFEDYVANKEWSKPRLKDDAVSSVFALPEHRWTTIRKRKPLLAEEVSHTKRKLLRKTKTESWEDWVRMRKLNYLLSSKS